MSQENVEIVRRLEAFNRRDFELPRRASMPTSSVVPALARGPSIGSRGHGVSRDCRRSCFEAGGTPMIHEVTGRRDRGRASPHVRAGRESGVPVERIWLWVCTVRDGQIVRLRILPGPAEALEAAGLSE